MTVYYVDESVQLYQGDALEVLRTLPDGSVDAVVTDLHRRLHVPGGVPMTEPEIRPAAPVTRPNGKIYRPRKPLRAVLVEDDEIERVYVYVFGTDDVDRARQLALRLESVDPQPEPLTWVRLGMRNGEPAYVVDEERGRPCLIFHPAVSP
jgi:hypothetical protein